MRNVLVTGGSRGLGLAIAQKLAAAGYRVIAVARSESEEMTAAIADASAPPGALHFVPFDLGKIDEHSATGAQSAQGIRRLSTGWSTTPRSGTSGMLATMHNAEIERLVRLNTLSPHRADQICGALDDGGRRRPHRQRRLHRRLHRLQRACRSTSATKASLLGFTRSLAREVGRLGINVNAVAPGFIDTDMTHGLTGEQRAADRAAQRAAPPRRSRGRGQRGRISAQRQGAQHHRHGADRGRRRHRLAGHRSVTRINGPLASR